jgi:hypothetical protein
MRSPEAALHTAGISPMVAAVIAVDGLATIVLLLRADAG